MYEYESIVKEIKGNRLDIKAMKSVGNFETISEIFKSKPTIIHISCHGEDDEKNFKLFVEEKERLGISYEFGKEEVGEIAKER